MPAMRMAMTITAAMPMMAPLPFFLAGAGG